MLYCFLHRFLWLLQAFPSLYTVFLILSQLFFQFPLLFLPFPVVTFFSFVGFHCVLSSFFYYMLPTIFTAFLYGFLYHFLSLPAFHAFSIYFSKSFTRLLQFPIVFAPFPLVVIAFSCTFIVFFQHVYCIVIVCS